MSTGQPLDRRGNARVRTEDRSSGKRKRFAARPRPSKGGQALDLEVGGQVSALFVGRAEADRVPVLVR